MTTETAYDGTLLVLRYAPLSDAILFFFLFIYLHRRQLFSARVLIPSSAGKYLIIRSINI